MTDIATIRTALDDAYKANRALIAGLADADLERPTPNPRWRVRQTAAHIAEDDAGTLFVAKLLARGKDAKAPDIVINLGNWWGLRKYRKARAADLMPVLDRGHTELMGWLDSVTPEQLASGGFISQMGRMTLAEFLVKNTEHSREHGEAIREALRAPLPDGGRAHA